MSEIQPLNATFFLFKKRDRAVILPATLGYMVLIVAIFGLFFFLNRQGIEDYFEWAMSLGAAGVDPQSMPMPPASVMALGPAYLLLTLIAYIAFAMYEAGCLRWLIRGETGGVAGLSLGADTWRVYFGYWIWFFLLLGAYAVLAVAMLAFAGVFAMGANTQDPSALFDLGPLAFAVILLWLVGLLYLAVRLAPAAATSVASRRFAFFDAWKVTRGRFWAMFGAFLLLFVLFYVLMIVISIVFSMVIATGFVSAATASGDPDPDQVFAMLATPQVLVPLALMYAFILLCAFVWMAAMFAVNARAAIAALEEGKIAQAAG